MTRKSLTRHRPFADPRVKAVFDGHAPAIRARLLELRELIFAAAAGTRSVGELTETVKWGQPAYLPQRPRTGTTIRIGTTKPGAPSAAMFFHCQTTLVPTFRELYGEEFSFEGNRAIVFAQDEALPEKALGHCIALALTYHLKAGPRAQK